MSKRSRWAKGQARATGSRRHEQNMDFAWALGRVFNGVSIRDVRRELGEAVYDQMCRLSQADRRLAAKRTLEALRDMLEDERVRRDAAIAFGYEPGNAAEAAKRLPVISDEEMEMRIRRDRLDVFVRDAGIA